MDNPMTDDLIDYRSIFDLTGRTVVITGAKGILGRQFCSAAASFGANLALLDVDTDGLDDQAARLAEKFGITARAYACNVADPNSVAETIDAIAAGFSRIDVLLNNAATKTSDLKQFLAPTLDYDPAIWRECFAVNLDGMFLMAKAVGRHMVEAGAGVIVQMSSIYGIMGPDLRIYEGSHYMGVRISNPVAYSASKAGVVGLTRHLATEWAESGIRVNAIAPGGVESGQNETFKSRYSARIPMGRMGRQGDIVGTFLWLASDASAYVTGQCISVDGGLSAW
jgi:NAD(P)-dependent dehydrogenase (short-subunit alcohol dehydrogenase family)